MNALSTDQERCRAVATLCQQAEWAERIVAAFVLENCNLPPSEFEAAAIKRIDAFEAAHRRRAEASGRAFDAADETIIEAVRKACGRLYLKIGRRSGRA